MSDSQRTRPISPPFFQFQIHKHTSIVPRPLPVFQCYTLKKNLPFLACNIEKLGVATTLQTHTHSKHTIRSHSLVEYTEQELHGELCHSWYFCICALTILHDQGYAHISAHYLMYKRYTQSVMVHPVCPRRISQHSIKGRYV